MTQFKHLKWQIPSEQLIVCSVNNTSDDTIEIFEMFSPVITAEKRINIGFYKEVRRYKGKSNICKLFLESFPWVGATLDQEA